MIKSKQVAELLVVSIETIRKWTRDGIIPFHRIGRSVRYSPDEIAEWLSRNGKGQEGK